MPRDELRKPLRKRTLRQRLWARRPSLFAFASAMVAAAFLAGGSWLAMTPHPLAGEPVVTAALPPLAEQIVTASTTPAEGEAADEAMAEDAAAESPEDVIDQSAAEITVIGEEPPEPAPEADDQQEASIIVAPNRPLKPAPIPAVTEMSDTGPLPRISDRGRKPFELYSQVTPLAVTSSGRPKITIVLGGMGLNPRLTQKAIDELPGDITLGFAPYGENLQRQVNAARTRGHEILLQVPMEPVGYPANSPGPKTLMSRFAGYSGITNYMGGRMLTSEEALKPVMKEVKARGLVYLEDASVSLTLSPQVVEAVRLPIQRATLMIDADPTAPAIAAALERLELEAIRSGAAIGTGSVLDVTIETVAQWAKTLQEKGILCRDYRLPPLRGGDAAECARPRVDWPPLRQAERRGQGPLVADAAGRHRQGRGRRKGRTARTRRGNRRHLRTGHRRSQPMVQLRPARTSDRQVVEGQISRPDPEVVRPALHRR